jgi:hypothetical protein
VTFRRRGSAGLTLLEPHDELLRGAEDDVDVDVEILGALLEGG